MTEHIKNRQKLKAIYNVHRFDDLLDMTTLSTEEKKLLRLHYIEKKTSGTSVICSDIRKQLSKPNTRKSSKS